MNQLGEIKVTVGERFKRIKKLDDNFETLLNNTIEIVEKGIREAVNKELSGSERRVVGKSTPLSVHSSSDASIGEVLPVSKMSRPAVKVFAYDGKTS